MNVATVTTEHSLSLYVCSFILPLYAGIGILCVI